MPTVSELIAQFPERQDAGTGQYRIPFRQSERIGGMRNDVDAAEFARIEQGACFNLCWYLAYVLLKMEPPANTFDAFANGFVDTAIRTQIREKFDTSPRGLNIGGIFPSVIEREYDPSLAHPLNSRLGSSLEIVNRALRARAVSMLCLYPTRRPWSRAGHALLFDTRTDASFFDPNHGWFNVPGLTVQNGYFAHWYDRFYHASSYKDLFEHGRRKLVIWNDMGA